MKKIYIYFSLLTFFIFFPKIGNGFFDMGGNIDIYNIIDEGYSSSSDKNYEYELTAQGETSIAEEMNRILKSKGLKDCIKSMDTKTIKKISDGGDIKALSSILKDECKDEKGNIPVGTVTTYQASISEIDQVMQERAKSKTEKTYEIAKIGLYSDGSTDNSPFDIIDDIKKIEEIIFSQKIEYRGDVQGNFDTDFENLLSGYEISANGETNNTNLIPLAPLPISLGTNENITNPSEDTPFYVYPGSYYSTYVCSENMEEQVNSSGLSEESLNQLLANMGSTGSSGSSGGSSSSSSSNGGGASASLPIPGDTGYEDVNDNNPIFPCESIFCIDIEFVMYNQDVFGGGSTVSIESIIKDSNEHLKKFANTSLLPAKMTTNNFEFGFFDSLSLPDLFHMGVEIQKRSPPILNIDNENTVDPTESDFRSQNLLTEYYKNIGLDYTRQNGIDEFHAKDADLRSIEDSVGLSPENAGMKFEEYITARRQSGLSQEKNNFIQKVIEKKSGQDDIGGLYNEFIELEKFSESFREYTETMDGIIRGMNKIPIQK